MGGSINAAMKTVKFQTDENEEAEDALSVALPAEPSSAPSVSVNVTNVSNNQQGLQHLTYTCPGFTGNVIHISSAIFTSRYIKVHFDITVKPIKCFCFLK
jgi:hypothetical protein